MFLLGHWTLMRPFAKPQTRRVANKSFEDQFWFGTLYPPLLCQHCQEVNDCVKNSMCGIRQERKKTRLAINYSINNATWPRVPPLPRQKTPKTSQGAPAEKLQLVWGLVASRRRPQQVSKSRHLTKTSQRATDA